MMKMYPKKRFARFRNSNSIFHILDIYNRHSFLREYLLENIFVCIFVHIIFYAVAWYANKIIKRIERANQQILIAMEENKTKLQAVIACKNIAAEYDNSIVKVKHVQNVKLEELDKETARLKQSLINTKTKLSELENTLKECNTIDTSIVIKSKTVANPGNVEEIIPESIEDVKILEPSFPPPLPPEPPRRKYGTFARPPGQWPVMLGSTSFSPPKVGVK